MQDGYTAEIGHFTYRSYIFFLTSDGNIELIPHGRYVAVVRREAPVPQLAGQRVRLADWYVEVRDEKNARVENETYGFLAFDPQGFACPSCDGQPDARKSWQPSTRELAGMRHLLGIAG